MSAEATPSTALFTDRYELTMIDAALRDGTASRRCVFEVFARRLPEGRRYGVVAGTGRVLNQLAESSGPGGAEETVEIHARTSYGDITIRRA